MQNSVKESWYCDSKNGWRSRTDIEFQDDLNSVISYVVTYAEANNGTYTTEVRDRFLTQIHRFSSSGLEEAVQAHAQQVQRLKNSVGCNPKYTQFTNLDAVDKTLQLEGEHRRNT